MSDADLEKSTLESLAAEVRELRERLEDMEDLIELLPRSSAMPESPALLGMR